MTLESQKESNKKYRLSEKYKKWCKEYQEKRKNIKFFCVIYDTSYSINHKVRHLKYNLNHRNKLNELDELNEMAKKGNLFKQLQEKNKLKEGLYENCINNGIIKLTKSDKDCIKISELSKICNCKLSNKDFREVLINRGLKISILNGYPIVRGVKINNEKIKNVN